MRYFLSRTTGPCPSLQVQLRCLTDATVGGDGNFCRTSVMYVFEKRAYSYLKGRQGANDSLAAAHLHPTWATVSIHFPMARMLFCSLSYKNKNRQALNDADGI
ncbi:hypothetical protein EVAR_32654_1 [Eumeta japonica]|uniref:Uncharacterized protein n=1 Tax=Eumeta variegata TaxID=151549 RepID=A0A4C1WW10_EUMVA|nr:hypothetical protein EVAR_32654_1 [Eumeta japonica]